MGRNKKKRQRKPPARTQQQPQRQSLDSDVTGVTAADTAGQQQVFGGMPPELVVHVLSFVPHHSARSVLRVCRLVRTLLTSPYCDFIWARWCAERWPAAVTRVELEDKKRACSSGYWQAFFRTMAGEHELVVYHWCQMPIKLHVRAEHTPTDLLRMLPKIDRVRSRTAMDQHWLITRFEREATFYLRTAEGEWRRVDRDVPLYTRGLISGGQAGQAGWRMSCSLWQFTYDSGYDIDYDNLDRHDKEELIDRWARSCDEFGYPDQATATLAQSKSKDQLMEAVRPLRPSQFHLI